LLALNRKSGLQKIIRHIAHLINVCGWDNQQIQIHGCTHMFAKHLAQLSFETIPLHSVAEFSGDGQSKPGMRKRVGTINDAKSATIDAPAFSHVSKISF